MSTSEEVKELEGRIDRRLGSHDRIQVRLCESLEGIREGIREVIERLARIEERHHALATRAEDHRSTFETERASRIAEHAGLESRLTAVENKLGLNTHGRDLLERLGLIIAGGGLTYLVLALMKTSGAGG